MTRTMMGWLGVAKVACILLHTHLLRAPKVARSPTNHVGVASTQKQPKLVVPQPPGQDIKIMDPPSYIPLRVREVGHSPG